MKPFVKVLVASACLFVTGVGGVRAQTISITTPKPYSVWQRSAGNVGPIPIAGSYTSTTSAIEARFAGGAWHSIAVDTAHSTFAGSLHNQPVGDGTIEVRFTTQTGVISSVANVAVGDVYVITGQSNALGQGLTNNTINPSLFASAFREVADDWGIANDPVCTGGAGSPWPLLANKIITQSSVPVGFISVAKSSTSLLEWAHSAPMNVRVFDQIDKATAGTNRIKAVLWYQGEADMKPSTSTDPSLNGRRAEYRDRLKAFAGEVGALPGAPKVVVGQTNFIFDPFSFATGCDNIRAAQSDLWDDPSANVLSGPVTYDIDLSTGLGSDYLHFKTNEQMQAFADRWWAAVHWHFYGGADGIGPRLLSAHYDTTFQVITLKFTALPALGPGGPMRYLGGFTVEDPQLTPMPYWSAVVQGTDTVIITTSPQTFSSQVTVSLGLNYTAWAPPFNLPVPEDSSTPVALKAVPFLRVPVLP